jgi:hypothetical protein
LCRRHVRQVEWQLDLLGLDLGEFDGSILDLLDQEKASHIGWALSQEARLARAGLHRAQRVITEGQIKLMELELRFAHAQFDAVSSTAPEHKTANLAVRLWRLQHQIDELEARIAKLRAGGGQKLTAEPHDPAT